jgi:HPt (histidine-containing phosphotransfer) domain-containing protein
MSEKDHENQEISQNQYQVINPNNLVPLDQVVPLMTLAGNVNLYYIMLGRLEVMTLNSSMEQLKLSVEQGDFQNMKMKVHSIKGACGYVGAQILYKICDYIQ